MSTGSVAIGARYGCRAEIGVYSTHIDSDHHFGRHWHESYGFGFLEHGAQAWWSGRGNARGYTLLKGYLIARSSLVFLVCWRRLEVSVG